MGVLKYPDMQSKELVMTIGLPFSGKSTLAKEYAARGYSVISRDALLEKIIKSDGFSQAVNSRIAELFATESPAELWQIKNQVALEMLTAEVNQLVITGNEQKFFYDGTNIQRVSRTGVLALREQGVKITGIVLPVPIEELLRRAETIYKTGERDGNFNEEGFAGLIRMLELAEEPQQAEGFDELVIREWKPEGERGELRGVK